MQWRKRIYHPEKAKKITKKEILNFESSKHENFWGEKEKEKLLKLRKENWKSFFYSESKSSEFDVETLKLEMTKSKVWTCNHHNQDNFHLRNKLRPTLFHPLRFPQLIYF